MQNTAAVTTEIKVSPRTAKSHDASTESIDSQAKKPFDAALNSELNKHAEKAKAKVNKQDNVVTEKRSSKSETSEQKTEQASGSLNEKEKAEKIEPENGSDLPVKAKNENDEIVDEEGLDAVKPEFSVVQVKTETQEKATIKQSVSTEKNNDVTQKNGDEKNKKHVSAQKPAPLTSNELAPKKSDNSLSDNQEDVDIKKVLKSESLVKTPTDTTQKYKNTGETQSATEDIKTKTDANLKTGPVETANRQVKKELVIKQINISNQAKENEIKTDSPIKGEVAEKELKNMHKNAHNNAVKLEGLTANSNTGKASLNKNELFIGSTKNVVSNEVSAQKMQVASEPVLTTSQREAIQIDKALAEVSLAKAINKDAGERIVHSSVVHTSSSSSSSPLTSATTASTTASVPVLDVQPSLRSEAWNKVMTGRVVWMAKEGIQRADLKLNPANLGPVDVRLTINNEQATVTFVAQHAATREALEQALPRLREGFQDNGLELTNADVSDQAMQQQQDEHPERRNGVIFSQQHDEDGDDVNTESVEQNEPQVGLSLYV